MFKDIVLLDVTHSSLGNFFLEGENFFLNGWAYSPKLIDRNTIFQQTKSKYSQTAADNQLQFDVHVFKANAHSYVLQNFRTFPIN